MPLSVRERADTIGTLRFISVFAMETLARWVPTTPDLEAKVTFGRHIWDFAQHADGLGKRTHELRASLHYTVPPLPAYQAALDALRALEGSGDRLAAFYEAFVPDLERRYQQYLDLTDRFLDEPSVRVVERIVRDLPRLVADAGAVRAERPDIDPGLRATESLARQFATATAYVPYRAPAANVTGSLA
jgi:hypothetical protein